MFEIGKIYKRKEAIHGVYGGQQQGGISTPANHPFVFLFTSDAGESYGYKDHFGPDGTFWYTGEGQVGDMEMSKGNLAIQEHENNGKKLFLFEYVKKAYVRFIGECVYVGQHIEERPDREDGQRKAIIFHIALLPEQSIHTTAEPAKELEVSRPSLRSRSLKELRELATKAVSRMANKKEVIYETIVRADAIKLYALKRANGVCEGCGSNAPFLTKKGPYLESHHIHRMADGGPDHPKNVIALCPNCHRRVHHAVDGNLYNRKLQEIAESIESGNA